jgi:hypothetical protein
MKIDKSSYVSGKIPVEIITEKGPVTLFANEIGYTQMTNIFASDENRLAKILVASISNDKGEKFTMEEAMNLKQSVAEPLIKAAFEVNNIGGEEKN